MALAAVVCGDTHTGQKIECEERFRVFPLLLPLETPRGTRDTSRSLIWEMSDQELRHSDFQHLDFGWENHNRFQSLLAIEPCYFDG